MSYFEGIQGQARMVSHLENFMARESLPHSLLLFGEVGSGKRDMAMAIAATLLGRRIFSEIPEEYAPVLVDAGKVFWLRTEKNSLRIHQWHTLLHDYLSRTAEGVRVVIIEDLQTARADFLNALLKSIEEPPEGVYFILITTKKDQVLPTILSRCMLIPIQPSGIWLPPGPLPAPLQQALDLLTLLTGERETFTAGVILLQDCNKDALSEVLHWLRVLARDLEGLRFNVKDDVLCCPQLQSQLRPLLRAWHPRAVQRLLEEILKAETALRLTIRPALVVDALLLALRRAIKE